MVKFIWNEGLHDFRVPKRIDEMFFFIYVDISKRFPFDWSNPIGYLIAIILEYIIWTYEYFIVACTLSLAIGGYWFAISATKEIQHTLHLINDAAQANDVCQSNELKLLIAEFIYAHGVVKKLSKKFKISIVENI